MSFCSCLFILAIGFQKMCMLIALLHQSLGEKYTRYSHIRSADLYFVEPNEVILPAWNLELCVNDLGE